MKKFCSANVACPLLAFMTLQLQPVQAQTFSEPQTVFYGKVLGTASAQDFLITTGKLIWVIQRADGESVTLETSLYSFDDDTYSYRLNVPHSAFALGLSSDGGGIPMPPVPEINVHAEIKVDGQPAVVLGPAGTAFTTEQLLRTATHRLDLGLHRTAVDTDGDGIADWWEDQYGLDKQDATDAGDDLSGDGLTALDAYLRGLDPNRDARAPALLTKEIIVYPSGSTAILLDSADLDSTALQLVYTLTSLPGAGMLTFRHANADPDQPDHVMTVGDSFTQADLLNGRLIYDHDGSDNAPGFFGVSVRDEDPAHPIDTGTIQLLAYEPADLSPDTLPALEEQRLDNHFYASAGYIVLDGTSSDTNIAALACPSSGLNGPALDLYLATYGDDRSYVIIGNPGGATVLAGGHRRDVLVAGENGGTLTGGGGGDTFVVRSFAAGRVSVSDFTPGEDDVVDMSDLPAVPDAYVHQYLRIAKTGGVHHVQTDLDGNASGFTNVNVSLPGLTDEQADLYALVESGRLLVGSLRLKPKIAVVASQPQASENGPTEGGFTLTRQGSLDEDLTVSVVISGSAQNGVDYMLVPSAVIMPAGVASVDVPIVPYQDGSVESAESVQLVVSPSAGYLVAEANQAIVTIEDRLMLVEIEAVEPIAVKETASPGSFIITRRDVINRDVVIRVTISGTASNGVDYTTLSSLVYMAPNQTAVFLQIVPKSTAQLAGGLETVSIAIKPDLNYRVVGAQSAEVLIIERNDSFAGWRAREFPEATGDAATFARDDSGDMGVSHFERYAFGLDPHEPDRSELMNVFVQDGKFVLTFRKPIGLTDVQYRVMAAGDLMHWADRVVPVVLMAAPEGEADPARVYYQVDDEGPTAFIVVEAEWIQ